MFFSLMQEEKDMGNNAIKVERMKKKLSQFSSDKLALLDDFIQTKLSTGSPKESQSIKQLEGIWQGLGFENIDVE